MRLTRDIDGIFGGWVCSPRDLGAAKPLSPVGPALPFWSLGRFFQHLQMGYQVGLAVWCCYEAILQIQTNHFKGSFGGFSPRPESNQQRCHQGAISMDGVGRAFDNIMVERLWRTVKYEDVYLRDYRDPAQARFSVGRYFAYYNHRRQHRSLDRRTPAAVYGLAKTKDVAMIRTDGGWSAVDAALGSGARRGPAPRAG